MHSHRLGRELALLRRGLQLGLEFGLPAVEAIGRVAEIVETNIYERGSLVRQPDGIAWRIRNPPLRMGAFYELRVLMDGSGLATSAIRFRTPDGGPIRPLTSVSHSAPLTFLPGVPVEFMAEVSPPPSAGRHTIRLELQNVAIPPRVWFEFTDLLRKGPSP